MKTEDYQFNEIVESIYNLPLEYKEELKSLLEHNIAEDRRKEIAGHLKAAQKEQRAGKLKFSSSVQELKKQL